jgi:hypothetical protein
VKHNSRQDEKIILRFDKMNRINHINLINKGFFLLVTLMCINSQTFADESLGSTIDCSEVAINYIDRPDMTHSERLEEMDKAFFESVNRFELCHLSNQSSSSSESASAGSEAGLDGTESGESGFDSVASPLMTGTETESTIPLSDFPEDSDMPENVPENTGDEAVAIYRGSSANGALPEDIPDANNDDVIAAQIRLAAEIEKDPVKKDRLWNEYRKYKGLPIKDNEQ